MKIEIDIDESYSDIEVRINAPGLTQDIERLISLMRMFNKSDLKLYEMEQQLLEQSFTRISKQSIINLKKVKSLKADINRKIRVTLVNGEQIIVSRMYSDELRKRLGIK